MSEDESEEEHQREDAEDEQRLMRNFASAWFPNGGRGFQTLGAKERNNVWNAYLNRADQFRREIREAARRRALNRQHQRDIEQKEQEARDAEQQRQQERDDAEQRRVAEVLRQRAVRLAKAGIVEPQRRQREE